MSETKVDYKRGEYSFACQGCGENVVHELGRPLELMPSGRKVFPRLICPQCRADLELGKKVKKKVDEFKLYLRKGEITAAEIYFLQQLGEWVKS